MESCRISTESILQTRCVSSKRNTAHRATWMRPLRHRMQSFKPFVTLLKSTTFLLVVPRLRLILTARDCWTFWAHQRQKAKAFVDIVFLPAKGNDRFVTQVQCPSTRKSWPCRRTNFEVRDFCHPALIRNTRNVSRMKSKVSTLNCSSWNALTTSCFHVKTTLKSRPKMHLLVSGTPRRPSRRSPRNKRLVKEHNENLETLKRLPFPIVTTRR
mmetsp:Transcript_31631/g.57269  ORF Transcript_31631/g.57269 Transcript_31631/m.57269 type:complete len:213 (+) Transcript_31631:1281-1919(+)